MGIFDWLRRNLSARSRRAARIESDVEEELALHVDMRAEALQAAGMPVEAARTQALREFGDVQDAIRYCSAVDREARRRRHRTRLWSELAQDARHALRTLARSPAFTAATVLTLAFASGATTAIYGILHTYLLGGLPFPGADRLMNVLDAPGLERFPRMPSLADVDWTGGDSLFEAVATWDLDGFTVEGPPHAESVVGAWVTPGYFDMLRVRPAMGRVFTADEYRQQAPVAIISHDLWVRRFGADPRVVGTAVAAHSTDRPDVPPLVTIVGVLPRGFWPIQWRRSDLLRPLPRANEMPYLVRLYPGVTRRAMQRRFDGFVRAQIRGDVDPAWHMTLMPALERHSLRARPLLFAVFGAGLFMLLAACASVAGALVSRMADRRGELALRAALGAGRGRILRQLMTETAVLATLAGLLGLLLAGLLLEVAGPVIERLVGTRVPGGVGALRPTPVIVLQALVVSALSGAALGLVPAASVLGGGGFRAGGLMSGFGRGAAGVRRSRVRRILVAGQLTLAMVLLFGAGLMVRTIARIATTDPGFRTEGVLTAGILLPQARYGDPAARRQVIDRILGGLDEVAGVRSAAAVFPLPFWPAWTAPVLAEGDDAGARAAPSAAVYTVSPAYFETMDLRVLSGRTLRDSDDRAAPLAAVVSESLARRLSAGGDVIGRRIRVRVHGLTSFDADDDESWHTVVGIVGDTRKNFDAGAASDVPDVYVPVAQHPRARQALVIRADRDVRTLYEAVLDATARVDPLLVPTDLTPLADMAAAETEQRRGLAALLGVFAAFALGLSALALYASLSYTVRQRRAELAVRMAIGASARSILRLVTAEALATAAVGVACGLVASLALGRVLRSQLFGVGAADPATLAAISVVLALVTIAACVLPGLRAARTDPAIALRE